MALAIGMGTRFDTNDTKSMARDIAKKWKEVMCLSYRMCGELNTDRRIEMRKISLFAVAATLILAGVGSWAASTTQARVDTPPVPGVDNIQLMMNARDLPTEHWVDYSVVFN
jgi:hypothetical protein